MARATDRQQPTAMVHRDNHRAGTPMPHDDCPPRTSIATLPESSDRFLLTPAMVERAQATVERMKRRAASRRDRQLPSRKQPAPEPSCARCAGLGWYRRSVPLGHPHFGVPVRCPCKHAEDQAAAARHAARASNLRDEMRALTFASYLPSPATREAWEGMQAFAEDPIGWIALVGGVGCGKTHLLAACANELLARGRHPLYVVVPDFLDYLRAAFADDLWHGGDGELESGERADLSERMRQAIHADVLLLDDLSAEKRTPWTDERLYMVLNARYNAGAPTVVATNVPPDSLEERIGSRLRDVALSRLLVLVGEDFRLRERPRRGRRKAEVGG